MADEQEGTAQAAAETVAPDGTGTEATQDPTAKLIEDYRRRQAGAERARQEAERQRDQYLRELEEARSTRKPAKEGEGPDLAAVKRELEEQFEQRLQQEVRKAEGKALDARFPAARAKFPEVTDAVKLAELEALFGEAPSAPKPIGNNPAGASQKEAKNYEDMTSAQLQEEIKKLPRSAFGLTD